jgi:2-succinyl-6-hydroxy-2,4-cyclohexadiene-1-carboxylate synthase
LWQERASVVVDRQLVKLHVEGLVAGPPGRMPLVLLHGFTGDTTTWDRLVPFLTVDRPVLAVDLVGHGRSPAPDDPTAYQMAAAVAQVVRAVRDAGIVRAHWLGYSMGGRVALNLALSQPAVVASLVLVGTSPGIDDPCERAARASADAALADDLDRDGIEPFVERWTAKPLFATQSRLGEPYLATARAQRLGNRPYALALSLRKMGVGAMDPLMGRLGEIRAPVLVVAGDLDTKFRRIAADMASRLARGDLVLVPDSGHAVQVEAPAALAAAVSGFLLRVDPV